MSLKRILAFTKIGTLECLTNLSVLLVNFIIVLVMFVVSFVITKLDGLSEETKLQMITSQFFSAVLITVIASYGFSNIFTNIVEKKENRTFVLLKATNMKLSEYMIGNGIANYIVFNIALLATFLLFSIYVTLDGWSLFILFIFSSFTFFVTYFLAHFFASYVKTIKSAASISTLIMLALMFSLTFTLNFGTMAGKDANTLLSYLIVNPIMVFYDVFLYESGFKGDLFMGSYFKEMLLLFGFIVVTGFVSLISVRRLTKI